MDKIIVAALGVLGIAFTYWYFLMKKDNVVEAENTIDIVVDGGYSPSKILISKNKTTTINFLRKDPSSCLEEVVIEEFKIRKFLPLNKIVSLSINPKRKGEFDFSCGMGMFHGKIIVN